MTGHQTPRGAAPHPKRTDSLDFLTNKTAQIRPTYNINQISFSYTPLPSCPLYFPCQFSLSFFCCCSFSAESYSLPPTVAGIAQSVKRLRYWMEIFLFTAVERNLCVLHSVRTGSGAQTVPSPVDTRDPYSGIKAIGA